MPVSSFVQRSPRVNFLPPPAHRYPPPRSPFLLVLYILTSRPVPLALRSTFPLARMTLEFPYLTKAITVPNETFNTVSTTDFARSVSHERPDLHVDLSTALQYGGSSGNIKLLTFLKEHVRREGGVGYSSESKLWIVCAIPEADTSSSYQDWDMILTSGSTVRNRRLVCD